MKATPVVFVTGASGYLGRYLVRALLARGQPFTSVGRTRPAQETHLRVPHLPVDLADASAVEAFARVLESRLEKHAVVLHAGALADPASCEHDPDLAEALHVTCAERLARAVPALYVSTDLVFGARPGAPFAVGDDAAPLAVYGRTKLEGERRVLAAGGAVARLPLLFGPSLDGRRGATDGIRHAEGEVRLFTNELHTPLHVEDAAEALVDLCCELEPGTTHHLAHEESVSRFELGQRFVAATGCPATLVATECLDPLRPRDVSLIPTWTPSRTLDEALAAC